MILPADRREGWLAEVYRLQKGWVSKNVFTENYNRFSDAAINFFKLHDKPAFAP